MSGIKSTKRSRESQLDAEQVKLAVPALFKYLEKTPKDEKKLFSEDAAFWLLMSLKKIPAPDKKPKLLKVPNAFSDGAEVCLFTKLPGKRVKEQLKEKGVTCVTKVISLAKLRKNFKAFKDKRTLCSQYDAFLCDDRIYHLIPKVIGKTFFSRKKEPTPVDLTKLNLDAEIKKALTSTKLRLGNGTCSAIKVGHAGQSQDEIIENIIAIVSEMAKEVPRGWSNIQCIHLKTAESVALPLYNSLPDIENVIVTEESPKKKTKEA